MPVSSLAPEARRAGQFWDYVAIARPDHWVKHAFIVPGILAALMLTPGAPPATIVMHILIGFASACFTASANYVINEWLDAEYDRHHPTKMTRPAAAGRLSSVIVYCEYAALAIVGIALAASIDELFLWATVVFLVSGVIYNVPPLRSKDRPYLDVLSEAINNPIRLVLGWSMVSSVSVPPVSLFGAFWMGGAFLMAAKRLSEYRFILDQKGPGGPGLYRRSFQAYTVNSLILSCFLYANLSTFFIGIFLIKYREEYVLIFPFIAALFSYYLYLGLQPGSVAQRPEKLHKDRGLVIIMTILVAGMVVLSFVDLPVVSHLVQSKFVEIHVK